MAEPRLVARIRRQQGPLYDLLMLLDTHRVMTTLQLAQATGAPDRTVRYRMERMQQAKLVDCHRPDTYRGSAPRHWWLLPYAARLVGGTSVGRGRPSKGGFVLHAAAITQVWLAVRDQGPAGGIELTEWRTDRDAWQPYAAEGMFVRGEQRKLTPDAWFHAELTGAVTGATAAFIETDRNTEYQAELSTKLDRYLAYANARAWQGPHPHPHCPPLLLFTTNQRRASTFMARARKNAPDPGDDGLMVAACALVRDPGTALTEPVWETLDAGTAPVALAELLADRVVGQGRAARQHARAEAVQRHHRRIRRLRAALGHFPNSYSGAQEKAVLRYLLALHGGDEQLLAAEPDLTGQLIDWWGDSDSQWASRDDALAAELSRLLRQRHADIWARQAATVLAAGERLGDDPGVLALAHRLTDGQRLVAAAELAELADVAPGRRDRLQHELTGDYEQRRDADVAAAIGALGWRARRHADPAARAAAIDATDLLLCDRCLLRYPQRDDTGRYTGYSNECPFCGGTLIDYPDPPLLAAGGRLQALRTRLADI